MTRPAGLEWRGQSGNSTASPAPFCSKRLISSGTRSARQMKVILARGLAAQTAALTQSTISVSSPIWASARLASRGRVPWELW